MRRSSAWFLFVVAMVVLALSASVPARADMIEELVAAPGTDLSNIHFGDTIVFDSIGSSTDAGEHLTAYPDIHIFWATGNLQFVGGAFAPTVFNDLTSSPVLATWTFLVTTTINPGDFPAPSPGTQEVYTGFPDCTDPVNNPGGCAQTNLDGAFRPADSNHLDFTIQTTEPSSLALLTAGLLSLGIVAFRRKQIA